jgi:acyl transferase domain-containing protein
MFGHSVGELGCAYADGTFTPEQTVLAAYLRGRSIQESKLPPGAMAAIGQSISLFFLLYLHVIFIIYILLY